MGNAGIGTPYWYEWEVGLIECLKMMKNPDIESVILQSSDFQSLDDVVINYEDKSIINIQVKHTDIDNNFTYSFLSSGENSLLKKLATEWNTKKKDYNFREIQIVTNKKMGSSITEGKCSMHDFITNVFPKLKQDYSYSGKNELEANAINWLKNELDFLGNEKQDFIKIFSFRTELGGLVETDNVIRLLVAEIIGTDSKEAVTFCVNNLLAALQIWATSRRKRQEITKEDVYQILCTVTYEIPQYELYPEKPIFPSRERFALKFIKKIKENDKKIIFLEGLPGSGKTNFVSYLAQLDDSIVDFRYYTYLPVNTDYVSFSDDEGNYSGKLLWTSILTQIKNKFEELNMLSKIEFPIVYQYLSVSDMRKYVLKYLPLYSQKIGRTCYFFIDGMDHAARSRDVRNSFLMQIPKPEEIGDGVKFILVGQPINDKYPSWLIKNRSIEYVFMPSLEKNDISKFLSDNKIVTNDTNIESLSENIIAVVGRNALNVIFALLELKRMPLPLTFDKVEKILTERHLNLQIDKYYEWIENSIEKNLLFYKLETIFAYSSMKNSLKNLALLCGSSDEEMQFVLNKFYPLVLCDKDGYFTFHNDVRLYLQNKIKTISVYEVITHSLYHNIVKQEVLEIYKYDFLFDILLNLDNISEIFELFNVEYIIDSVKYNISLNKLVKQFVVIMNLLMNKREYYYLNKVSTISQVLSQFANCVQNNKKEYLYIENQRILCKTKSEKYILDNQRDIQQIVKDIYHLLRNKQFDRGKTLFNEYLIKKDIKETIVTKSKNKEKFYNHLGYIYRHMQPAIINEDLGDFEFYADFIDGWLRASTNYIDPKDIQVTFSYKYFYPNSLCEYVKRICEIGDIDLETYQILQSILMRESTPISALIELSILGSINGYKNDELNFFIFENLDKLLNEETYRFNSDRILGCIKAWFCIYSTFKSKKIDKIYKEILKKCHISETSRGYTPAMVQKDMAKKIFDIYYKIDKKDTMSEDTIYNLIYFSDRYGVGSCHDCNSYEVISFLRKIFVNYAKNNPFNNQISDVCRAVFNSISWEKPRHTNDFDILFYYANEHSKFIQFASYWCGPNGAIWNQEYSTVESCCKSIMAVLEKFEENEVCEEIRRRKLYKLFGYVDHKDYSLKILLDYYKCIPLSETKLLNIGMWLLSISDAASDIGDNRIENDIILELLDDAVSLGVKYANALFELKNKPSSFISWRDKLLEVFYKKIDIFNDDKELMALYQLTNVWINSYLESFREFNRLNTLKKYNSIILSKISDKQIRKEIKRAGNYDFDSTKSFVESNLKCDMSDIINLFEVEGYSKQFENVICKAIAEKRTGILDLLIHLREVIQKQYLYSFADNCVFKYIIQQSEYGFFYTGIQYLFEMYRDYFSKHVWESLFENIVFRLSEKEVDGIFSLGTDIAIYTLNYYMRFNSENIEYVFSEMCHVHELFITANDMLSFDIYQLNVNHEITSMMRMLEFQLGHKNHLDDI